MAKKTEHWASRIGVVLAVSGSAVGLGNFLRFPGQAAENGGGVFMIPYFIAFLLLGIPICWAEWTLGRYAGARGFHSAPAIFQLVSKRPIWRYFGVVGVLIPLIIYMYYVIIESWCLGYALSYLFGWLDMGNDVTQYAARSQSYFSTMVGLEDNGLGLDYEFWMWAGVFTLNFILIYRGITRGIETFCKFAMPVMLLCAVVVLIRVLTLGTPNPELPERNVFNGLGFMWNPKPMGEGESWWTALFNPQLWMNATSQIFFSLSVGFGIIINYASYLRRKTDVVLTGLTAASTNEFFEVFLGGLITIPAAFIFLGAAGAVGGTFGLGFNTLPVVFAHMPGGNFFGFLWFFMLFLAAITSSLSMLQPSIAFLEEALGLERKASVAILGLITAIGSFFVLFFSKGLVALDTMDFWVGTALIFVMATIQVVLYAWVFGVKRGVVSSRQGADMPLPRFYPFVIKYVSPTYLLLLFIAWAIYNLPDYVASLSTGGVPLYAVCLIGSVLIFLLLVAMIAGPRWEKQAEELGTRGGL